MINVKLDVFEGPFDLLFSLIEKHKIDIYDIPIALIAEEFVKEVEGMEEKNIDNIGEFLIMAATLLKIKSRMLLPLDKDENEQEIDPRLELVTRLLEYKKYKDIADTLRDMEDENGAVAFGGNHTALEEFKATIDYDTFLEDVSMDVLTQAFLKIMKQEKKEIDPNQDEDTKKHITDTVRKKRVFTVEMQMTAIYDRLINADNVKFSELFGEEKDKMEKVMTFLALLEMIKMKRLKCTQDEIFGEITIEKADSFEEGIDFNIDINVDKVKEDKKDSEESKEENENKESIKDDSKDTLNNDNDTKTNEE